ncbi:MAG: OmpA family protein [Lautropia sp.]|nr:OmpA family protein [Lautropia sp.]
MPQLLRSLQRDGALPTEAAAPPPGPALAPLAVADASTSAPERGLVRVFFATASRAIVAPDDGLGLLLREAVRADEIRVTGFTDATGSREANAALALARAEAVVHILLRRGIPPDRILSRAVGADEYLADNASDRGRALNRRAEVLLLKNGEPLAFGMPARAIR